MHNIYRKITILTRALSLAIVSLSLFISIGIVSAYSETKDIAIAAQKLSPPSFLKPIANEGYAVSKAFEAELLFGIKRLERDGPKSIERINTTLKRLFEKRKRAWAKEPWVDESLKLGAVEFTDALLDGPAGSAKLTAIFRFTGAFEREQERYFKITCQNGEYMIKKTTGAYIRRSETRYSASGEERALKPLTVEDAFRLADVDGIIVGFNDLDTNYVSAFLRKKIMKARKAISDRGISHIVMPRGELPKSALVRKRGDAPYYALEWHGAIGRYYKNGKSRDVPGYEGAEKLSDDILTQIMEAVDLALRQEISFRGGGSVILKEEDIKNIKKIKSPYGIKLNIRDVKHVMQNYDKVAKNIIQEIEKRKTERRIPQEIEVTSSVNGIDIVNRSKAASAIGIIKTLGLKKVIVIGDSIGTKYIPGHNKDLLFLNSEEAAKAIGYHVDLITYYVGRERAIGLPSGIHTPLHDRRGAGLPSVDMPLAIYEMLDRACHMRDVIMAIGEYFFSEQKSAETLEDILRERFGDKSDFLKRIDLEFVRLEGNVLTIPYLEDVETRKSYEIVMSKKEFANLETKLTTQIRCKAIVLDSAMRRADSAILRETEKVLDGFGFTPESALATLRQATRYMESDNNRIYHNGYPSQLVDINNAERLIVLGDLELDIDYLEMTLDKIGGEFALTGNTHMVLLGNILKGNPCYADSPLRLEKDRRRALGLLLRVAQLKRDHPDNFHIVAGEGELEPPPMPACELKDAVDKFLKSIPMFIMADVGDKSYFLSHGLNLYCGIKANFFESDKGNPVLRKNPHRINDTAFLELFGSEENRPAYSRLTALSSVIKNASMEEIRDAALGIARDLGCVLIAGGYSMLYGPAAEDLERVIELVPEDIDDRPATFAAGLNDKLYILKSSGPDGAYLDIDKYEVTTRIAYPHPPGKGWVDITNKGQLLPVTYSYGPKNPRYEHSEGADPNIHRPLQIAALSLVEKLIPFENHLGEFLSETKIDIHELQTALNDVRKLHDDISKKAHEQSIHIRGPIRRALAAVGVGRPDPLIGANNEEQLHKMIIDLIIKLSDILAIYNSERFQAEYREYVDGLQDVLEISRIQYLFTRIGADMDMINKVHLDNLELLFVKDVKDARSSITNICQALAHIRKKYYTLRKFLESTLPEGFTKKQYVNRLDTSLNGTRLGAQLDKLLIMAKPRLNKVGDDDGPGVKQALQHTLADADRLHELVRMLPSDKMKEKEELLNAFSRAMGGESTLVRKEAKQMLSIARPYLDRVASNDSVRAKDVLMIIIESIDCPPLKKSLSIDDEALDESIVIGMLPGRLFFILDTLIENAMKGDTAVTLRLATVKPTGELLITAQGIGKGIDAGQFKETAGNIIELFDIQKRPGERLYAGMAKLAKYVDIAGGTIEVRSQPDKGATFIVVIPPAKPASFQDAPGQAPGERLSSSGLDFKTIRDNILIASDTVKEICGKAEESAPGQAHLILFRFVVPDMGANPYITGYMKSCRKYYESFGMYTVHYVDNYQDAEILLSANPGWNRKNTIIGMDSGNLKILENETGKALLNKIAAQARIMNIERPEAGSFVPIDIYLGLMAIVVRIDKPLTRPDDSYILDRLDMLFDRLGAEKEARENFIKTLTKDELFDSREIFLIRLPAIRPIKAERMRELYDTATIPLRTSA